MFLKTNTGLKSRKDIQRENIAPPKIRGRADDQDYEQELKYTRHQLACLDSSYIQDEWIIDNSDLMVEDVYAKYFLAFLERNA
jgi:hypothetical protein